MGRDTLCLLSHWIISSAFSLCLLFGSPCCIWSRSRALAVDSELVWDPCAVDDTTCLPYKWTRRTNYTLNSIVSHLVVAKVHVILQSFIVSTWMRDTIGLVLHVTLWNTHKGDVRTIWIYSFVTYSSVVHSTWPSRAMWRTHAPTLNKWQKKKKKKTLHILTHGGMQGCVLTSFGGLHQLQKNWYKGEKCDNKE